MQIARIDHYYWCLDDNGVLPLNQPTGTLESISKPRLSTGSELFIFNRFPRCHYLVWWVRVTVSLGVKVRVSVEVRVRVRVSNLLGSG